MIGQTISHYRILERLGGGGMGVVYRAQDTRLDRTVALKFLPLEWNQDSVLRERFSREARAASGLDHPHICTIFDVGESPEGQLFIAMAYCPGETLKQRIQHGPMSWERDSAHFPARSCTLTPAYSKPGRGIERSESCRLSVSSPRSWRGNGALPGGGSGETGDR